MAEPAKTETPSERRRCLSRLTNLKTERESWIEHWQDCNDFVLPRRLRYLQTDRNKGTKRNDKIINNVATRAARILAAGKMAGETSPARPWTRYVPEDMENATQEDIEWTEMAHKAVMAAIARSNIYPKLHELWFLQGVFATATIYVEEDFEDDIRATVFPLGQYCLASSGKGRVDTIYREFSMTVEQVVREFGKDNVYQSTKEKWDRGQWDEWINVLHVVEPNVNRDTGKIDNLNMPFKSSWWEIDAPADWDKPLRKSGYEEQPFFVARWDVIGEDIYGSACPAMDCLGDNKGMQILEKRKAEAVDKTVRPPMKAPISAKTQRLSLLPGDVSYVDESAQSAKFEPAIKIDGSAIMAAKDTIGEHEQRIQETFYVHLFLAMLMRSRTGGCKQPLTATEVDEIGQEKMLMLGPVVTRDTDDVLDPLHNRILRILIRSGKIPMPPPTLAGKRIKIEYISIMAQAQKLLGTAAVERFASFVGSLSAAVPKVLDIPNWDKIVKNYAEMLGVSPDEINTQEVIDALRQAAAQAQQAKAQGEAMAVGADAAKAASQAQLGQDSVLSRLLAGTGMAPAGTAYGRA
jgi:hypothetical protein